MQPVLVSVPVAPWQDDKSLSKVAACFFIHFQVTLLSLSALFLVKYQFDIVSVILISFSPYKPPNFVDPCQ